MDAIVNKNTQLLERKHFLMRALDNHNITQEQYDKEIPLLEKAIAENLSVRLEQEKETLNNEVLQVKKTIISDGNMKRAVANILIKFLSKDYDDKEIKGIFRQGYKIQRGK